MVVVGLTPRLTQENAPGEDISEDARGSVWFQWGAFVWLCLDNDEYKPQMLVGQICWSSEYTLDPNVECILGNCNNSSMKYGVFTADDDESGGSDRA